MRTIIRTTAATAALFALTTFAGCGSSYDDLPDIGATNVSERTSTPQRIERAVLVDAKPEPRVEEPKVEEPELVAGPTLYGPGDEGPEVREIQARLRQIAWFYGDVTDFYGDDTKTAVAGFQVKRGIPSNGEVDQRTLDLLVGMTTEPTADDLANVEPEPVDAADGSALDPRCLTGRVLCVDKSSSSLRWVVDGDVQMTLDARFGGNGYFTREGQFSVFMKSRDHVSSLYETSMPFAMFFSGGQAVHYSPDFAATGYDGASHGCVNIRDYDAIASLFDQVQLGDRVVVYWS
jgi:peptidoglycan hydrolase-like protein with peptidoglycan-binding domain